MTSIASAPPWRAPRRQQDMGPPARAAARPLRAQSRCAVQQADRPLPAVSPPLQPPDTAARAGQHPARQVRGRSGGIGAQQHGTPSRSRQPQCPGQAHARQGQLVLQPARSGRGPQPGTPHTPGNDTMTTIRPRPRSCDRHRAAPCSQCRLARKRTPAASPGSACSRRTTPILLRVLRKNGAEHPAAIAQLGLCVVDSSCEETSVEGLRAGPGGTDWPRRCLGSGPRGGARASRGGGERCGSSSCCRCGCLGGFVGIAPQYKTDRQCGTGRGAALSAY